MAIVCRTLRLLIFSFRPGLKDEKAQRPMARMKTDENGFGQKANAGAFDFYPFSSVFIRAELGFTGLKARSGFARSWSESADRLG
jgi:hypothetical protein